MSAKQGKQSRAPRKSVEVTAKSFVYSLSLAVINSSHLGTVQRPCVLCSFSFPEKPPPPVYHPLLTVFVFPRQSWQGKKKPSSLTGYIKGSISLFGGVWKRVWRRLSDLRKAGTAQGSHVCRTSKLGCSGRAYSKKFWVEVSQFCFLPLLLLPWRLIASEVT